MWMPNDVSSHDITILADTNGFEIFAPTGRMKPWSFSSFSVWRYSSQGQKWQNGRIHWSLLGSYWSED